MLLKEAKELLESKGYIIIDENLDKDYEEYTALRDKERKLSNIMSKGKRHGTWRYGRQELNTTDTYNLTDDIICKIEYAIDDDEDATIDYIDVMVKYTGPKPGIQDGTKFIRIDGSEINETGLKKIRRTLINLATEYIDDDDLVDEIIENSNEIVKQINTKFGSYISNRKRRLNSLDNKYSEIRSNKIDALNKAVKSFKKETKIGVGSKLYYKSEPCEIVDSYTDKDTGNEYWKIKMDKNGRSKKVLKSEIKHSNLKDYFDKFDEN